MTERMASILEHLLPQERKIDVVNMSFAYSCNLSKNWKKRACDFLNLPNKRYPADPSHFSRMPDTVFVAAAGNVALDIESEDHPFFPAAFSNVFTNVITVGSLEHQAVAPLGVRANRACFSNFGEATTVAVEGSRVYVVHVEDRKANDPRPPGVWYSELRGTSFSAPLVTGVVALLRSIEPNLTPEEIRTILIETADIVRVDSNRRKGCGDAEPADWKRVNAGRAVAEAIRRADARIIELAPTPKPSAARPTPPMAVPDVPVSTDYWIDEEALEGVEFVRPTATPSPAPTPRPTPTPQPTPPPAPTLAVSAGWAHTCAVEADGSVVCWGDDEKGQASPPDGEFLSVSAGWAHSCGIRTDRSVVCWGRNEEGQSSAPRGAFISVSAGRVHSCGVRLNGLVECWGEDQPFGRLTIPPNLFNSFSSVSATNYHSCGVRRIGTVACWGFGEGGRTMPPPDLFTSVSVGGNHSCGIRTDGSVACWGHNEEGQGTPPPGTFVSVSVSKEGLRTCGVRTDGSATCWGAGILVSIVLTDIAMPVPIQPDGPFSSISAGYQHVCGLKADGDVACWGTNGRGQAMPPGVSLVSVSPGDRHECGLRADGSVACYGYDFFEQTNVPPGSFTSLSAGHSHNCAIKKADGSLTCWGMESIRAGHSARRGVCRSRPRLEALLRPEGKRGDRVLGRD